MATKILNDRNLQLAAESIARAGYVEPTLNLLDWGYLHLLRVGDTKVTRVQTIDLTNHLRTAWPQILATLPEGTPIPDPLRTPRFFGNGRQGVTIDQKGIKVEMFCRAPGWLNGTDDEGNLLPLAEGELSVFTPQGGYMLKSDLQWDGTGKVATVKNDGAWVYSDLSTGASSRVVQLPAGTVIKNVKQMSSASWTSMTYTTHPDSDILILYPLAEPIVIGWTDLGLTELNITLPNISTGDILVMADSEGIPTHSVTLALDEAYQTEDGKKHCPLLIGYNPEWQQKHPGEFPSAPVMQWTGHEWTANYRNIYADHLLLQNVLDILKRNNLN